VKQLKERLRLVILKALAIIAVIGFLYPLELVLRVGLFGGGWNIPNQMFDIFLLTLGILGSYLLKNKKRVLKALIAVILAVLPAIVTYTFFRNNLYHAAFEVLFAYAFFLVGMRTYYAEYSAIISVVIIEGGLFFIAAAFVLNYWGGLNLDKVIIVYAYVFVTLALILRNQANIDRVFLKMNRKLAGVTKNLRRFNIISVFLLLIITVLLFNFKVLLKMLFEAIGIASITVITTIGKFLATLTFQLKDVKEGTPDATPTPVVESTKGTSLVEIVMYTIVAIVLLYLLYQLLKKIWPSIKKLFALIAQLIHKFFNKNEEADAESDDFKDEIEQIRAEVGEVKKHEVKTKALKRNIKSLRKISNPAEKVRFLYLLVLDAIVKKQVEINKSDTTGEIYIKVRDNIIIDDSFYEMTNDYNNVRYGDGMPSNEQILSFESRCIKTIKELTGKI